ncbi:MAG: hypothetical protein AB1465_03755 [Patescibacteria group bacterium]
MVNQIHLEFVKVVESAIQTSLGAVRPMEVRKVLMSHWVWFLKDIIGMDAEKIVEISSKEEKFWKLVKEFDKYDLPEFSFLKMLQCVFLITGRIIEEADSGRELFSMAGIFRVDLLNYSTAKLFEEAKGKLGAEMNIQYPNSYYQALEEANYFLLPTA